MDVKSETWKGRNAAMGESPNANSLQRRSVLTNDGANDTDPQHPIEYGIYFNGVLSPLA